MDLDTALHTALVDDDIKKHCHVNSNEDGDRFVGIKADSDNAMVYFPIGYQLPETDNEIRTDIKHLIQVLSEFTTSEDRLLAINKFAAPQSVDFPINAYKSVIEYYFSIGGKYYVEVGLIRLLRQVLQVSRIGQERLEIKYHWFSKRVGLVPLFIQNLRLEQRHRMIRSKSRRLIVSVFMKHLKSWDGFMFLICQNSRGRIRMSKLRLQY